jgi:hypothetical protein
MTALERVCDYIRREFDRGMLGVMAAKLNVPEGKLRDFMVGDYTALTVPQAVDIARDVFMKDRERLL